MTNYERLRNMTNAELAEWVGHCIDCTVCPVSSSMCRAGRICIQAWRDWLIAIKPWIDWLTDEAL